LKKQARSLKEPPVMGLLARPQGITAARSGH
jgi:hypothetical protein